MSKSKSRRVCWGLTEFFSSLLDKPDNILAAHLKSDFYRGKGKEWEATQRMAGNYDSLVRRSPVGIDLLQALSEIVPATAPA